MSQPFRFLNLPREIRRMVYEYIPETVLQPLLSEQRRVYYENARAPTALLVINKLIYREVKAWIDVDTRSKMPVTVVICPKNGSSDLGTQSMGDLIDNVPIADAMHQSASLLEISCKSTPSLAKWHSDSSFERRVLYRTILATEPFRLPTTNIVCGNSSVKLF